MLSPSVAELVDAVKGVEIAVDGDDLAAIAQARELLLAKTMEPLRAFDEMMLYQLTKASSTTQFLERCAGLSPADAGRSVSLARKLKAMPLTEAAWLAGTISSGQVRTMTANVKKALADRFRDNEAEILAIIAPLDAKETDLAMQRWVNYVQATLADDPEKPPREDEFYHSPVGERFVSNGSFGSVTGAVINKAIELCENDNPRDNDTRSPAERRGEALADVCGFYVDYQNRIAADPDAEAPAVPKKRNWPQLIGVNTTGEMEHREGAQLLGGPRIDHHAYEALSCTAQLLRLMLDEHGAIRSYDLMPSTVTDALFGAVAARDQHCRWPGCHKNRSTATSTTSTTEKTADRTPPATAACYANSTTTEPRTTPKSAWSWNPTAPCTSPTRMAPPKPPSPQSDNPDCRGNDAIDKMRLAAALASLVEALPHRRRPRYTTLLPRRRRHSVAAEPHN